MATKQWLVVKFLAFASCEQRLSGLVFLRCCSAGSGQIRSDTADWNGPSLTPLGRRGRRGRRAGSLPLHMAGLK